ncbi:hypothetical protein [Hyphomonas sp.]|uniref:hypothetical protein n=1 Tax=Hyphomonas sp. TaxID=87 RepID=UPI000C8F9493|nr:hypothetical protein [Hyphomonas sp.]MAL47191.1 hypothetical protein [Hyphomonas sp.]|tara:strand:+ start:2717 stop:3751 length:1035 start_codon:yes stop_codon:yes gene_type:complete
MSQENSLFQHRLFIDNQEVLSESSGTISFNGNGQVNNLGITINDIDIQYSSLFNQKIELFLNESGTDDSIPIFRGFIRRYIPSENNVKLSALDVRSILSGRDGIKINSSDVKNYDGKTVAQFIYEVVTDNINYDETIIGLDMLTDTDVPITMTGLRGNNIDVLSTINSKLKSKLDKSDYSNPLAYFLDVKEGLTNSNIVIVKDKALTDTPSYTFSYEDGIQKITYKKVLPLNTVYYNDGRSIQYTNRPTGQSATTIGNVDDIGEARKLALEQILLEQQQNAEITVDITKCYDIGLGSLVFLDVPDDDVHGIHRVQGKKITFGKAMKCQLLLNKKPIVLSNYIQQ